MFEVTNLPIPEDVGKVVNGVLVVFDTGATFYPSKTTTVRCLSDMQQNLSSVYLEGVCVSCEYHSKCS